MTFGIMRPWPGLRISVTGAIARRQAGRTDGGGEGRNVLPLHPERQISTLLSTDSHFPSRVGQRGIERAARQLGLLLRWREVAAEGAQLGQGRCCMDIDRGTGPLPR